MCRFIETICVRNGKLLHLKDHQRRMDYSINHFYPRCFLIPQLEECLSVPEEARHGWYKCRVVYSYQIEDISWEPYQVRTIKSLSLIQADDIDYAFKYADRTPLQNLIHKKNTDDVIIVKNGFITDSSYANLLFYRNGIWFTPSTPLLQGTQRNRLLKSGIIHEKSIRPYDLYQYEQMKFINAMLDIDSSPVFSMTYKSGKILFS